MRVVQSPTSGEHPDDSLEPRVSLERASGSLSSLGQPMSSQYPFEYRPSGHGSRTPSSGSGRSPHPQSSSQANSLAWSSSPRSRSSPRESFRIEGTSSHVSPIEPPPRHPSAGGTAGRRRRAGTAPSLSSSPLSSEDSGRVRTVSVTDQTFGVQNPLPPVQGTHDEDDDFEADFEFESGEDLALGSQEEAEKDDSIGLLSSAPSPKSSIAALRRRASSLVSAQRRPSNGSFRAASGHPSPTASSSSIRSRAVSLVPVIGQTQSLSPPPHPKGLS
ncbi:hypothetical protein BS47DRAFT_174375 [Hydnum rufescens UP504]|uniref:Uncharacterized protein n=1 Tax=Hydnum rufescens UP504 TaxID=1448309 RepID=A0A9P6DT21_9AGAM|nr:hypothetical protein BS47DRAFT_174375 [Hydnum rufescens UP504]